MQPLNIFKEKNYFQHFFLFLFLLWALGICNIPYSFAENYSYNEMSNQHGDSSFKGIKTKGQSLEEEYNRLLEEKKILDSNKSFQKRRKKRKYKNRPYIKELVEKEEKIIKRLKEIELIMDAQKSGKK